MSAHHSIVFQWEGRLNIPVVDSLNASHSSSSVPSQPHELLNYKRIPPAFYSLRLRMENRRISWRSLLFCHRFPLPFLCVLLPRVERLFRLWTLRGNPFSSTLALAESANYRDQSRKDSARRVIRNPNTYRRRRWRWIGEFRGGGGIKLNLQVLRLPIPPLVGNERENFISHPLFEK